MVVMNVAFNYSQYGSSYQCWLDLDNMATVVAQYAPILIIIILIFAVIEAAGSADFQRLEVKVFWHKKSIL